MPAFVTHVLFGQQLQYELPPELKSHIDAHPAAYYWGLQGPDLLFFRDAVLGRSPLPGYGGVMHREQTGKLLQLMVRYIRRRKQEGRRDWPVLASYFMGFLCHYLLDRQTHPFVYYLQERRKRYRDPKEWHGLHHQIESQIDTVLCKQLGGGPLCTYGIPRDYRCKEDELAIGRLYRQLLHSLYSIEVEAKDVAKSFDDARFLMKFTLNSALLPLVGGVEALLGRPNGFSAHIRPAAVEEDILNEHHGLWTDPSDPDNPHNDSFLELLEQAKARALEGLPQWFAALHGGELPDWSDWGSFDRGNPNLDESNL